MPPTPDPVAGGGKSSRIGQGTWSETPRIVTIYVVEIPGIPVPEGVPDPETATR
jgi:hypothetical protein